AVSFGVTDEIFALSMAAKEPLSPWYSFGMMGLCIFGWTLGTALGATLGGVLPAPLMNALGIALYAMLTAAIVPPSRDNRLLRLIIVVSMAASGAAAVLPLLSAISKGLRIVLLTLVITGWAALRHPLEEVRDA
ncbi:MAG: AzlC family ABC transporter permease, partial [Clostridiales bacterium]|nr:AzlC family ABC transporter permease [Clostridiales bacterium]